MPRGDYSPNKNTPVLAHGVLRWTYDMFGVEQTGKAKIDTEEFTWYLDQDDTTTIYVSSFPSFTLRKQYRRGRPYWYAFLTSAGKTYSRYVGKSENITAEKIEQIRLSFAEQL